MARPTWGGLILWGALCASGVAQAQSPGVEVCPNPTFTVSVAPGPLRENFDRSQTQIEQIARENGGLHDTEAYDMGKRVGLYISNSQFSAKLSLSIQGRPGMGFQACARSIDLSVSYEQSLFVASEFPQGSCSRDVSLEHERQHSRIQERATRAAAREMQTLGSYGGNRAMGESSAQAQQNLRPYQDWVLQAARVIFNNHVQPAQAALDTRAQYEREGKMCGGETQRLLRR